MGTQTSESLVPDILWNLSCHTDVSSLKKTNKSQDGQEEPNNWKDAEDDGGVGMSCKQKQAAFHGGYYT